MFVSKLQGRVSVVALLFAWRADAATAQAPQTTPVMFRGNAAHTGAYASTGLQLAGLAWRVVTGGDVVSSPAIASGTVYVGSNDSVLYAIDARSGKIRWRSPLGSAVTGSPAVTSRFVYVTTYAGDLFAVDASTGVRRWHVAGSRAVPMPWGHESGDIVSSSPVISGSLVVFGSRDGHVYAVDGATGRRRWAAATTGHIWSSPAVDRGRVYVGSADGFVYCFALETGKLIWKFATSGSSLESARFGFDRRTVESSPSVWNGMVFVGARDGFLYAIDADSGTMRWRFDHSSSWVVTSPAVSNGVVYAGSSDNAFVQALDAATGRELWRTRTGGIVWSSPAISGQTVYVGDGVGRLHALDARTGADRWIFRTGESVHSSPSVSGDLVVFGSSDGGVYALRTTSSSAPVRAVFFDSALRRAASIDDPELAARYFRNRGYVVLDSRGLDTVMRAQDRESRGSVIVFATDVVPDSVALRSYLERGGRVVWPGIPPGIWPRDAATGKRSGYASINWNAPRQLTGVDHSTASFDDHGARPTPLGTELALTPFRGSWSVDPREVSDVLAFDDRGRAVSWIRKYAGVAGAGFVRVPPDNLYAMYLAAEFRPVQ